MTVGIGLDHGHYPAVGGKFTNPPKIMPQGIKVNYRVRGSPHEKFSLE
jgi:hypothetical protein